MAGGIVVVKVPPGGVGSVGVGISPAPPVSSTVPGVGSADSVVMGGLVDGSLGG